MGSAPLAFWNYKQEPKQSELLTSICVNIPRPPNVPPLRASWSLLDGIWGLLKGTWGVLVHSTICGSLLLPPEKLHSNEAHNLLLIIEAPCT